MSAILDAARDATDGELQKFYEVVNPEGVADFLTRYPATYRLLLDARAVLRERFGSQVAVSLEFLASPEADDEPQLYVGIDTSSMEFQTARRAVRDFRAAFLQDRSHEDYRNVVFSPI